MSLDGDLAPNPQADGGLPVAAPEAGVYDTVMQRLEDQIGWYDRKSRYNQKLYKLIKMVEIVAASLIPLIAVLKVSQSTYITAGLGVLITLLEGVLHLNQYQLNWTTFRSTCEALKHEKYVYLAHASPYSQAGGPLALLAERVESLVSQEHAKWAAAQQQEVKR